MYAGAVLGNRMIATAHEANAAALPGGIQHFGDCGLDAFVGVRDREFDARKPRLASLRRNAVQKA